MHDGGRCAAAHGSDCLCYPEYYAGENQSLCGSRGAGFDARDMVAGGLAEPWEFVHRDSDEEAPFLVTGHCILAEALIAYRLIRDAYDRFPRQEWLKVLSDAEDELSA